MHRSAPDHGKGLGAGLLELGYVRRQPHAHEKPRQGLREVFQEWRAQTPSRAEFSGPLSEIAERQTVDLPEIHDERIPVVGRIVWGGKEVQSFHSTLKHVVPSALLREARVYLLKIHDGMDRTGRYKANLALLEVAALGDDDQVVFVCGHKVSLAVGCETGAEFRNEALMEEVPPAGAMRRLFVSRRTPLLIIVV